MNEVKNRKGRHINNKVTLLKFSEESDMRKKFCVLSTILILECLPVEENLIINPHHDASNVQLRKEILKMSY
jgi:hypothetical protein